jgi:hypothetical protein
LHEPSEEKHYISRHLFFSQAIRVGFQTFSYVPYKILLGNFNAKLGKEDPFKLTNGNEILHQDSIENGVTTVTLPYIKTNK